MAEATSTGLFGTMQKLTAEHWNDDTLFNAPKATGFRKCSKCGQSKPVGDFYRKRGSGPGYTGECKQCLNVIAAVSRAKRIAKNKAVVHLSDFRKECSRCKQVFPADGFLRSNQTRDALTSECRGCRRLAYKRKVKFRKKFVFANGIPVSSKVCGWCHVEKPASEFGYAWSAKDGLRRECSVCQILSQRARISSLPKYLKYLQHNGTYRNWDRQAMTPEFLMSLWEKQRGLCVYTGIAMTHVPCGKREMMRFTNASLDRIDSSRGYTVDNVQLVCFWANTSKGCLSEEQFKYFLQCSAKYLNQDGVMASSASAVEEVAKNSRLSVKIPPLSPS